jgi:carbamoyl-phosphate synthase large subunit
MSASAFTRPIRVLLTASGAPGAAALIRALRENGEREVVMVGTDMQAESGGRFLCDAFHLVPPGDDPEFAATVADVAATEEVDVVFPQSSAEVGALAAGRELFAAPVLVASPEAIATCTDKYATADLCASLGVRAPATRLVRSADDFRAAAAELGYPGRDVCMKPPAAKGSRGFRVLSAGIDRRRQLLEARPGPLPMSVDEAIEALGEVEFPPLLVMELATGPEYTVDGICQDGRLVLGHAKTRERIRAGLAMFFATVDRPDLVEAARAVIGGLELDWFVNVQFVGDSLLEINPRISTIVYQEDLNLPWLGVRFALGEIGEEELAALVTRVRPTRRAIRYHDQVEYDDEEALRE